VTQSAGTDASCFGLFRFPYIRCLIAAPPVVCGLSLFRASRASVSPVCEDFLHDHQGHAFGAPAGTASATLRAQTARHQAANPAHHPQSAARTCWVRYHWRRQLRRFLRGRPASRRLPRAVSPHPAAGGTGRSG
jgi:hypothetical protein